MLRLSAWGGLPVEAELKRNLLPWAYAVEQRDRGVEGFWFWSGVTKATRFG
jgi:hypothetical protein